MHLRRIQIPEYRVLRDVDLRFDAGISPQLFPLGSENGGGKSTLLQLVFVLLHCAGDEERAEFIRNMMASFHHPVDQAEKLLARFELWDGEQTRSIEFVSLGPKFLTDALRSDAPKSGFGALEYIMGSDRGAAIENLKAYCESFSSQIEVSSPHDLLEEYVSKNRSYVLIKNIPNFTDWLSRLALILRGRSSRVRGGKYYKRLQELKDDLIDIVKSEENVYESARTSSDRVLHMLAAKGDTLISWYARATEKESQYALVVRESKVGDSDTSMLLALCRDSVFLLAPSSQPYLFLPSSSRRAFIADSRSKRPRPDHAHDPEHSRTLISYLNELERAAQSLPGFFAYDWLSIEPLLELFRMSRDQDFAEVVKTGSYGSTYTDMLQDLNSLLFGKQVHPLEDLSGVKFTVTNPDGTERDLGPEDLSRGELKRLMVYAWLKANRTENAIVLMDELEVSFHPDWQYGVARDLVEWAPTAQFLLATHSYEVCRAVTPAHVRELEPKLSEREQDGASS